MRFPINNEFKKCIIEKVGPQLIFYVNFETTSYFFHPLHFGLSFDFIIP
jgi:hypothetical protein